jgi:6-phosphogluconolactonase
MEKNVKIFTSPYELAMKVAEDMSDMINESASFDKIFTVAFSGGSTPELLFKILGKHFADTVAWQYVHVFWGDERCVPPDDKESNFGMAMNTLLGRINIPANNIHRINGEEEPEMESFRYSEEVSVNTKNRNGLPVFDLILLGLGEDGHTASIFPRHTDLFESDKICEVAIHPDTRQKRITLTGRVINNAKTVVFLVTGRNKAVVVENMFKNKPAALNYPASFVVPSNGSLSWYMDKDAYSLM